MYCNCRHNIIKNIYDLCNFNLLVSFLFFFFFFFFFLCVCLFFSLVVFFFFVFFCRKLLFFSESYIEYVGIIINPRTSNHR